MKGCHGQELCRRPRRELLWIAAGGAEREGLRGGTDVLEFTENIIDRCTAEMLQK